MGTGSHAGRAKQPHDEPRAAGRREVSPYARVDTGAPSKRALSCRRDEDAPRRPECVLSGNAGAAGSWIAASRTGGVDEVQLRGRARLCPRSGKLKGSAEEVQPRGLNDV